MIALESAMQYRPNPALAGLRWSGEPASLAYDEAAIRDRLRDSARPVFVVKTGQGTGFTGEG